MYKTSVCSAIDPANGFYVTQAMLGDLRSDVGDARVESCKTECAIREAIQTQGNTSEINFRALDNSICHAEKAAIVFAKDGIIESLKAEARLTDRISDLERSIDLQFCKTHSLIESSNLHLTHLSTKGFASVLLENERGFCKLRTSSLEDQLLACQREHDANIQNANFNTQFGIIGSAIQSLVNQTQGLSNAVVQIGAANIAVPLNTQNQLS